MPDNSQLIQKLHVIDYQIQEIKAQLDPPVGSLLRRTLRKTPTFVLSNWSFFAFLIAVGLAVWAYWYYDVSYFESQRNIAQSKQSAEFYRKLGDNLMLYGERDAAADSYSKALKINPNNMEATRGLLKTEVFDSLEGQNDIIPEVVNEKIAYLDSLIIDDKERFILAYFKGERYEEQEKYDQAKAQYEESIKLNPGFVYGYIAVAYDSILAGDGVDYGMRQLNEALKHDPDSALALNNLGFCYMVKGKYSEALTMFDRARQISPYLEVWINLGEAQRYKGDDDSLEQALDSHKRALGLLSDSKDEDESDIAGELAVNFMPERVGDNETPKAWVTFTNMDEKRALVYYELSFDYAMRHDWIRADQSLMSAFQLDQRGTYPDFIANKIISIERFSEKKPDQATIRWFEKQRHRLLTVSWRSVGKPARGFSKQSFLKRTARLFTIDKGLIAGLLCKKILPYKHLA